MPEKVPGQFNNESIENPEQMEGLGDISNKQNNNLEDAEKELSMEIIEKVMDKVQDIDKKGTAYSSIMDIGSQEDIWKQNLKDILRTGLLGFDKDSISYGGGGGRYGDRNKDVIKRWRNSSRKNRDAIVYFNIVGRSHDIKDYYEKEFPHIKKEPEINKSFYFREAGNDLVLIFDISSFEERLPYNINNSSLPGMKNYEDIKQETKTYRINTIVGKNYKTGELTADSNFGFMLSFRVAPRYFRGIVFKIARELNEDEKVFLEKMRKKYNKGYHVYDDSRITGTELYKARLLDNPRHLVEEEDKKLWECKAKEIAMIMRNACGPKTELMVPIYDCHGNLLWPKQMSYQEVKKFVEEKDAKRNR